MSYFLFLKNIFWTLSEKIVKFRIKGGGVEKWKLAWPQYLKMSLAERICLEKENAPKLAKKVTTKRGFQQESYHKTRWLHQIVTLYKLEYGKYIKLHIHGLYFCLWSSF